MHALSTGGVSMKREIVVGDRLLANAQNEFGASKPRA
jgi:hypothetical protein